MGSNLLSIGTIINRLQKYQIGRLRGIFYSIKYCERGLSLHIVTVDIEWWRLKMNLEIDSREFLLKLVWMPHTKVDTLFFTIIENVEFVVDFVGYANEVKALKKRWEESK